MYEIEGVISTKDSYLHFLNRCIPFFPKTDVLLKPREQRFIEIDVPFIDKIPGLAKVKLLDLKTGCTNTIKVKFIRNTLYLNVANNSSKTLIFRKDEAMGVVDMRSIGYYKVKQDTAQHHLQHYYEFYIASVM